MRRRRGERVDGRGIAPMATLSLDLSKKATEAEISEAQHLQVAALTKDTAEVNRLLATPTIKRLLKRGVLKIDRRTVLEFEGEEYELTSLPD